VVTWEGLASADGSCADLWEKHLDTVDIFWVDNCRYVEEGDTVPRVPGNFSEHTRRVSSTLRHRPPVANPSLREGHAGDGVAFDLESWDGGEALILSEDDAALGGILVDELDDVLGCCEAGKSSKDEA